MAGTPWATSCYKPPSYCGCDVARNNSCTNPKVVLSSEISRGSKGHKLLQCFDVPSFRLLPDHHTFSRLRNRLRSRALLHLFELLTTARYFALTFPTEIFVWYRLVLTSACSLRRISWVEKPVATALDVRMLAPVKTASERADSCLQKAVGNFCIRHITVAARVPCYTTEQGRRKWSEVRSLDDHPH
jgi:hypothetical protein